jgi:hypothetical protein
MSINLRNIEGEFHCATAICGGMLVATTGAIMGIGLVAGQITGSPLAAGVAGGIAMVLSERPFFAATKWICGPN